jgi:hypothetical protein
MKHLVKNERKETWTKKKNVLLCPTKQKKKDSITRDSIIKFIIVNKTLQIWVKNYNSNDKILRSWYMGDFA